MRELLSDLRHAALSFGRTPGFALAAVLSLAIGVGVNTAIYSVVSALLLRPLPYADAERLTILWNRSPGLGIQEDWFSTAQYFDVKDHTQSFEQIAIAIGGNYNVTEDGGDPERIGTIRASSGLLPMLGVTPLVGRLFVADDDVVGAPGVAVLGHATWVRRYGSDPAVVGRRIVINGAAHEIIGVLPPSFSLRREVLPTLGGARDADLMVALPLGADAATVRTAEDYNILAKRRRGVTTEQAQAELDALTARLRAERPDVYPPNGGLTFGVVPLQEQVVGDVRWSLIVLMGSVACVLLVACANVANLLLSRGMARQKEMAVRSALGASRPRLVRQLLTESLLLSVAGSGVALVLAALSLDWMREIGAASVPRVTEIALDRGVLLFTLVLAVVAGLAFGAAPAWRLARLDAHVYLKDAGRGSAGAASVWAGGGNVRRLLVSAEIALSVVLLIAAGLLVRSFAQVQNVPPGFNADHLLTVELTMTGRKYSDQAAVLNAYTELWERLPDIPGVRAAGGVTSLPLSQMYAWGPITVEGRVPAAGEEFINVDVRMVGGDYFRAMEIPLRAGRRFDRQDTRDQPRVAIVDERMAQELWPNADPIGKRVRTGGLTSTNPWITVVGVVGRVKQYSLDSDSRMAMYLSQSQSGTRAMTLVLKSEQAPEDLARGVRATLRALDPDLPMFNVRTMDERVRASLAERRFAMQLLALFAVIALVLAVVGIYGVMSYLVSQGTRELGIRLALGATPAAVVWLVGRHTALIAFSGVAAGLALALAVTRFMQSLLFEVSPADPATFAGIGGLLVGVALVAGWIPARRAARIDPLESLRAD